MSQFNIRSKTNRELSREFTRIVEENQRNIYLLVLRIVERETDAEDITQEVFIKFYKSYDSFRGDSKLSTMLYRIAYNLSVDFLRRKRPKNIDITEVAISSDNEDGSNEEKMQLLDEAIKKLSIEERALITLFYHEDRSVEEISRIVALSIANVKTKLHRIRKKIYEYIGEQYYE